MDKRNRDWDRGYKEGRDEATAEGRAAILLLEAECKSRSDEVARLRTRNTLLKAKLDAFLSIADAARSLSRD